jgi:hypothetical protein
VAGQFAKKSCANHEILTMRTHDKLAATRNRKMLKLLSAVAPSLMLSLAAATLLSAQTEKIRVIAFGAHPDDCDIRASGSAALWTKMGVAVKFVSVTNGDAGHQTIHGAELAKRRLAEAKESARRLGIEYDVLNNHDGALLPTLPVREQIIREIRQ